jgi:hypothetical protein
VRDTKTLKEKAIASLKIAMATFNSYKEEEGPITSVLLHLQQACEMLLKAVLVQNRAPVFDKGTGKSISFETRFNRASALFAFVSEWLLRISV